MVLLLRSRDSDATKLVKVIRWGCELQGQAYDNLAQFLHVVLIPRDPRSVGAHDQEAGLVPMDLSRRVGGTRSRGGTVGRPRRSPPPRQGALQPVRRLRRRRPALLDVRLVLPVVLGNGDVDLMPVLGNQKPSEGRNRVVSDTMLLRRIWGLVYKSGYLTASYQSRVGCPGARGRGSLSWGLSGC